MNIGKSVVIKGELAGSEDLTIDGHVEGRIELKDHVLTIGPNGKLKAQVFAKAVIVLGEVTGNVTASEKVDVRDGGSIDGDIVSPRVAIAEGAFFRGSVDMHRRAPSRAPSQRMLVEVTISGEISQAQRQLLEVQSAIKTFLAAFGFAIGSEVESEEEAIDMPRLRAVAGRELRESTIN